jgi:plastocyanin
MRPSNSLALMMVVTAAATLAVPLHRAYGNESSDRVVTVAFGAGLNTLPPPSSGPPSGPPMDMANHHLVPKMIHVHVGGVVNFVVSGGHFIRIYNAGIKVQNVTNSLAAAGCTADVAKLPPPNACGFLIPADPADTYYTGVAPPAPPSGTYVAGPLANAQNRQESVSFAKPGTYLVICAITPHFFDGMYGYVHVSEED